MTLSDYQPISTIMLSLTLALIHSTSFRILTSSTIEPPTANYQQAPPIDTRSSKKRKLVDTDLEPSQKLNTNPLKRSKEFGVEQMLRFLEQLREKKHPPKHELKPRKVKRPPLFKNINLEMQAFIVFLRYG